MREKVDVRSTPYGVTIRELASRPFLEPLAREPRTEKNVRGILLGDLPST